MTRDRDQLFRPFTVHDVIAVIDGLVTETAQKAATMAVPGSGFDEIGAGAGVGVRLKALRDAREAIIQTRLKAHAEAREATPYGWAHLDDETPCMEPAWCKRVHVKTPEIAR